MIVCQTITFDSKAMTYEVHICISGVPPKNVDQVHIQRSSGQGHGHTSRKTSAVFPPPLRFSERTNTTAQTDSALQGRHISMRTGNFTRHICHAYHMHAFAGGRP